MRQLPPDRYGGHTPNRHAPRNLQPHALHARPSSGVPAAHVLTVLLGTAYLTSVHVHAVLSVPHERSCVYICTKARNVSNLRVATSPTYVWPAGPRAASRAGYLRDRLPYGRRGSVTAVGQAPLSTVPQQAYMCSSCTALYTHCIECMSYRAPVAAPVELEGDVITREA